MKKFKSKFLLGVLSASMLFTVSACGSQDNNSNSSTDSESDNNVTDVSKNDDRTTFTVGFDANFPPYGYLNDDGEYIGFDLDLAEEVAERNGWELIKQPIDWDSKDLELSSGTIDCIWNGFTMNGREGDYTWSEPYVDNSQVFVVAEDSGISTFDDLAGKIIAVQTASSALDALNSEDCADLKNSFAQLIEIPDYNTAFMNLEAGSVDAIAMDIGVANYQIENRDNKYIILDESIISEKYGIGFLKGNDELKDKVQETLNAMVDDGTFLEIANKWNLTDNVVLGK